MPGSGAAAIEAPSARDSHTWEARPRVFPRTRMSPGPGTCRRVAGRLQYLVEGSAMNLFRRILVPHDFSEHASRALAVAAELAREHHGRLLVLYVITPFQPLTPLPAPGMALIAEDLVGTELRRLRPIAA